MSESESATAPVHVLHHSGSQLEVHRFGATVSSFKDASGSEWFEMSPIAVLDGKKPLRGGVPVVFLQFGEGPLPKHGFVRNTMWKLEQQGDGFVELSLSDSESSREIWPHPFRLVYRLSFTGSSFSATLQVVNTDKGTPFEFQALLHPYFHVDNVDDSRVDGVRGEFLDKTEGFAKREHPVGAPLVIDREVDRIYPDLLASRADYVDLGPVASDGTKRRVQCEAKVIREDDTEEPGVVDLVVWNPWADKARGMGDFPNDGYKTMTCVEPGRVSKPVPLGPKQAWELSMHITTV